MSVGASGTYAIQGTDILQPTTHHWVEKTSYGVDGNAHEIYAGVRSYELGWQLMSASDFAQLVNFYNLSSTGTVAVDLPQFGASGYVFARHSGCSLQEPVFDSFFNEHLEGVRLLIFNIPPA